MIMLSVDPGTRSSGIAVWENNELACAQVVVNDVTSEAGPRECAEMAFAICDAFAELMPAHVKAPQVIALEVPQIYQRAAGKSKGNPNGLLPVYGVAASLAALIPHAIVRFGTPHDWKGGVGKPDSVKQVYAIEPRVLQRLSEDEQSRISWPRNGRQRWDLVDALGIGLHHLNRFNRIRTFARE